jgi:hypothetical protein
MRCHAIRTRSSSIWSSTTKKLSASFNNTPAGSITEPAGRASKLLPSRGKGHSPVSFPCDSGRTSTTNPAKLLGIHAGFQPPPSPDSTTEPSCFESPDICENASVGARLAIQTNFARTNAVDRSHSAIGQAAFAPRPQADVLLAIAGSLSIQNVTSAVRQLDF